MPAGCTTGMIFANNITVGTWNGIDKLLVGRAPENKTRLTANFSRQNSYHWFYLWLYTCTGQTADPTYGFVVQEGSNCDWLWCKQSHLCIMKNIKKNVSITFDSSVWSKINNNRVLSGIYSAL